VIITIDMPQMAVIGLSENWLFRHCGNAHWRKLCRGLGVRSADLRDDAGERLYPTFVAICGRYSRPLAAVCENDRLKLAVALAHYGQSFVVSEITLANADADFRLEMATTFVAREAAGRNELRRSTPRADLDGGSRALASPPEILGVSQTMRRGEMRSYKIGAHAIDLASRPLSHDRVYEPSPYIDFNGAGLLYFASYPTIADTLERRMVHDEGLGVDGRDWALATSAIARDVYYYGNLDVGARLRVALHRLDRKDDEVVSHVRLTREGDERPLADVLTVRQILP